MSHSLLVHEFVEPDVEVPPHVRVMRDPTDTPESNSTPKLAVFTTNPLKVKGS